MTMTGKATATLGFVLSAIAITAAMGAGAGARLALWDYRQGFRILNWAAYFGIAGTVLSLAGAILGRPGKGRRGFLLAVAGIVLGAVAFGVPGNWYRIAKRVPMIHDITTDTENPPLFVSVLALRKDAPNSAAYGGPEIAARQHAAYPDIRPLVSEIPPAQAFERARDVAGWVGKSWTKIRRMDGSRQQPPPGGSASRTTSSSASHLPRATGVVSTSARFPAWDVATWAQTPAGYGLS
jgi:hypothetical protein